MENMIALEQIVNKLPGVKGAKILADDGGTLKEIHILADVKKPAKQLVRDIETAIYAASGVKIDRKIVSVAQISDDESDSAATETYEEAIADETARFSLLTLETKSSNKRLTVNVIIDDDGKQLSGSSVVDVNDDEKYMAAVEATVAAIRESIPSFRVEFIERLKYGLSDVILVVCSAIMSGERRKEAGARLFKKDSLNDIVLVILETLNKM
ncbi:MAG: hypothetical protein H0Z25_04395 [Kosmotoga sp.]|uniref:Uncharacterized protein n=1 Tax=Kosmotoga arenicorallina TaxID=688066 RepID=A0A7C5HXU3_9BACT|nr:hypothetical protein [Kosmotoga sp.]MBO8166440.1 hypothetical protein [Kosmotoga sp.]HHF08831.1 hypothetical protein [Kosmotoga arenicorallina]